MVNPMLNGPTSEDKLWAGLAYSMTVCCAVPAVVIYALKKDESDYLHFHTLQAIALGVGWLVLWVLFAILSAFPPFYALLVLALFALAIYWILLMIQAFLGRNPVIPAVGPWIRANLMNGPGS